MENFESNKNKELLVSIRCLVYNHEPYIRQCLDGFVMQKTNFRFEAIVHDDASTDGTAAIIREYAEKYPDIIKPILETENQYSKHDGSLGRIINSQMRGKYVAMCEGDDYWTDPYKLQKQVDFLESHSDYSMCFHNATLHFEDNVLSGADISIQDKKFSNIEDKDYLGKEIYAKWIVPTASVVYRRSVTDSSFYKENVENPNFIYGDIVLFLTCATLGKVRGFSDVMSVYRKHIGSLTSPLNIPDNSYWKKYICHHFNILLTFGREYRKVAFEAIEPAAYEILKSSNYREKSYYINVIKKFPLLTIYATLRRIKYNIVKSIKS